MEALRLGLPYPPSVNHYWRSVRCRTKYRVILSREAWAYRDKVQASVPLRYEDRCPHGPLGLVVTIYPPDRRKRDIDNVHKAILDALQYIHAITDDSQMEDLHVIKDTVERGGRAVVEITQIKERTS